MDSRSQSGILIGLATSVLGVVLLQVDITYLGATMAAIFCLIEPISSIVAARILLNEQITPMKAVGFLIAGISGIFGNEEREAEYLKKNLE